MLRNVYLEGELGQRFSPHIKLSFTKPSEIFKALDANYSGYKEYIMEQHEKGVGYHVDVAGNELEDPMELLMEMKKGDVIITPVPAGSKSGPMKILAAVALVVVTAGAAAALAPGAVTAASVAAGGIPVYTTGFMSAFGSTAAFGASLAAAAGTVPGLLALGVATNLAMGGITQMMAPDPSTDSDQEESYLFNGSEQNIVSGDPIPILYGRLRVPGQPISFETSSDFSRTNYSGGAGGDYQQWTPGTYGQIQLK